MLVSKIDIFFNPHKAQRLSFCDLSTNIASLDANNAEALSVVQKKMHALLDTLREHSLTEDTFAMPLLKDCSESLCAELEKDHERVETLLSEVEGALTDLCNAAQQERPELGITFYRTFHRFMARYLLHLDMEETQVMPCLWRGCSPESIIGIVVSVGIHKQIDKQPEEAKKMISNLLNAMTQEECDRMFASIKKYAPAAIYEYSHAFVESMKK